MRICRSAYLHLFWSIKHSYTGVWFWRFYTFNISDGGTFNFNELLCWPFDGWLWCVELWCVVQTWKIKYFCIEYFLFDICLSVFIKICFILMIIWTCLSKCIWNACISFWFNHKKGCIDKCKYFVIFVHIWLLEYVEVKVYEMHLSRIGLNYKGCIGKCEYFVFLSIFVFCPLCLWWAYIL